MNVYFIHSLVASRRITSFHGSMFHGVSWRDGIRFPSYPPMPIDGSRRSPLQLEVNAYHIHDLLDEPGRNLVVSHRAKEAIAKLPRIEFLQVEFKKVVWYPYHEDDDSFYTSPEEVLARDFGEKGRAIAADDERLTDLLSDTTRLYDLLEDVPEERAKLPPYYEILTWKLEKVLRPDVDAKLVEALITTPFDTPYPRQVSVRMTREIALWYPILWSASGAILSEQAFELLEPFIDREYIGIGVGEL